MKIQILSVNIITTPTAKGSYQTADVAFKNLTYQGKVEGKKVMSFGVTGGSFTTLSTAQPGEVYDVTVVKNDKGYNDWVEMKKGTADGAAAPASSGTGAATTPSRSTYETHEERAAKQIYIVRQSSISAAVNALSVGSKTPVAPEAVIDYARKLEAYVFSTGSVKNTFEDVPDFPAEAE